MSTISEAQTERLEPQKKIKIESEKEANIFRSLYLGHFQKLAEENERLKKRLEKLDHYEETIKDTYEKGKLFKMCNYCLFRTSTNLDIFSKCASCLKTFCCEHIYDTRYGKYPNTLDFDFYICPFCNDPYNQESPETLEKITKNKLDGKI